MSDKVAVYRCEHTIDIEECIKMNTNKKPEYVEVKCLGFTDHTNCAVPAVWGGANAYECDKDCTDGSCEGTRWGINMASSGFITLEDVDIWGIGNITVMGANSNDLTFRRTKIIGGGNSALDFDNPFNSDDTLSGDFLADELTVMYSGCSLNYPLSNNDITSTDNLHLCNSQSQCSGYGDGIALGASTGGGNWTMINSSVSHNVQDGWDFLYAPAGNYTVKRSRFEGNGGNQLKFGSGNVHIENSKIIGNCGWFNDKSFKSTYDCAGGYAGFDNCRAGGNTMAFNTASGTTTRLINNTIYCNGDICMNNASKTSIGNAFEIENNIYFHGQEFNSGGADDAGFYNCCPYGQSCGCSTQPTSNYNVSYNRSTSGYAPSGTGNVTTDPLFNEATDIEDGYYYGSEMDVTLSSTSSSAYQLGDESAPLIEDVDYNGTSRGADWEAGAYEYGSTGQTCATSCDLCTTQATCEASSATDCSGGYCCWHSSTSECSEVAEATCNTDCTVCSTESACNGSDLTCYWWSTSTCNATEEPDTCAADDCSLCTNQTDCEASTVPCDWSQETILEDYTQYDEADPNSSIGVDTHTLTMTSVQKGTNVYVRESYGDNYFGDFVHDVTSTITDRNEGQFAGVWAMNNGGQTMYVMDTTNQAGYVLMYGSEADNFCNDANAQGCWLFTEGSGTTVADSTSNTNTGNFKGSGEPAWDATNVSYAVYGSASDSVDFDGTDDYISIPADSTINDLTSFSWVAWVRPEGAGENNLGRVMQKGNRILYDDEDGAGNDGLAMEVGTDGNARVSQSNANLTHDTWTHVAVTYSSGSFPLIYINGAEATYVYQTIGTGTDVADNSSALYVGNNSSGSRSFNGKITEAAVFDDVLTEKEIKKIYRFGLTGSGKSTPGWFLKFYGEDSDIDFYADNGALPITRYPRVERSGTTVTAKIYDDSGRTSLLDTLSITGDQTLQQYVYGYINFGETGTTATSLTTNNLNLNDQHSCVAESAATCSTDCTICETQQGCEGSAAGCYWWSDNTCNATEEVLGGESNYHGIGGCTMSGMTFQ